MAAEQISDGKKSFSRRELLGKENQELWLILRSSGYTNATRFVTARLLKKRDAINPRTTIPNLLSRREFAATVDKKLRERLYRLVDSPKGTAF